MAGSGKQIRWSRFVNYSNKRGIIVPIDHGLTYGPLDGIGSVRQIAEWIGHPAMNGIIAHKGMIERLGNMGLLGHVGVMMHVNGMSALAEQPDKKEMLTSIEAAVILGADAISLQINLTPALYAHNLTLLGAVVDQANRYGLPVLAMAYDKFGGHGGGDRIDRVRHIIRNCYEMGVEAVKTDAPEDLADMRRLLDGLANDVAIFFSGGALAPDDQILRLAQAVAEFGGAGLCVGRNIFQRPDPGSMLESLQQELGLWPLSPAKG